MVISARWPWTALVIVSALALGACGNAQTRKADYMRRGQSDFAAANYASARLEFRSAAQIDPKDPQVHFMLGRVSEKVGDARDAVAQYGAALELDQKLTDARAALGRIYLFGGAPDKAITLVEAGLANDPQNAKLLVVRGAARAQQGNDAGGIEDAKQALQQAPNDDYAIALLSSLYKKKGDLDQAWSVAEEGSKRLPDNADLRLVLADLALARRRFDLADQEMAAVIKLQPTVIAHRYRLARLYLDKQDVEGAERVYREAVTSNPADIDPKRQLVEFLAAQRGAERATSQAADFLKAEPDNDALKLMLGDLLVRLGQSAPGEDAYRSVIAHNGTGARGLEARDHLAALLFSHDDSAGAGSLIDQVLKQNPGDNQALILRAHMALGRSDAQSAIGDLRAVLRDQPNAVGVMRDLAIAYQKSGELDQAEEILRTALQISPKVPETRLALAQVLSAENKLDQSEPLLQELAKDYPSNLPVQETLFKVLASQKRYDDALTAAMNIERLYPKAPLGYYLAGMVQEQLKRPDAASRSYESALDQDPVSTDPLAAWVHLQVERKQVPKALERLDALIAKAPQNPLPRHLKGDILLGEGQVDAAINSFSTVVQTAPQWPEGYDGLARAQLAARKVDAAIGTLQAGVDATHGADALVGELSSVYERQARIDDAVAVYDRVLSANGSSIFAANNLAMLLVTYKTDAADLARATRLADQLAVHTDPAILDTRGWVKFKNGDFHGAESLLQQAVDRVPTAPDFRYHLGMAEVRSGESEAARQNLESALSVNRSFAGMDEARATLAQLKKPPSMG